MNEKLLLTILNKKIFGDNSSQTHIAEKLGKNVYAKKTRQMKWINFTVYTFQFPWSEFVSKKDILIQSSLNWFHNFFWPGLLKIFWPAVRNQQIPSVSQESHTTMFSQSKKPILSLLLWSFVLEFWAKIPEVKLVASMSFIAEIGHHQLV